MTTIAKGTTLERFSSEDETLTFTPGSGGYIRFDCSAPSGITRPTGRQIRAAESIDIQAGSTVFAEAVGADATYTTDDGAAAVAAALGSFYAVPETDTRAGIQAAIDAVVASPTATGTVWLKDAIYDCSDGQSITLKSGVNIMGPFIPVMVDINQIPDSVYQYSAGARIVGVPGQKIFVYNPTDNAGAVANPLVCLRGAMYRNMAFVGCDSGFAVGSYNNAGAVDCYWENIFCSRTTSFGLDLQNLMHCELRHLGFYSCQGMLRQINNIDVSVLQAGNNIIDDIFGVVGVAGDGYTPQSLRLRRGHVLGCGVGSSTAPSQLQGVTTYGRVQANMFGRVEYTTGATVSVTSGSSDIGVPDTSEFPPGMQFQNVTAVGTGNNLGLMLVANYVYTVISRSIASGAGTIKVAVSPSSDPIVPNASGTTTFKSKGHAALTIQGRSNIGQSICMFGVTFDALDLEGVSSASLVCEYLGNVVFNCSASFAQQTSCYRMAVVEQCKQGPVFVGAGTFSIQQGTSYGVQVLGGKIDISNSYINPSNAQWPAWFGLNSTNSWVLNATSTNSSGLPTLTDNVISVPAGNQSIVSLGSPIGRYMQSGGTADYRALGGLSTMHLQDTANRSITYPTYSSSWNGFDQINYHGGAPANGAVVTISPDGAHTFGAFALTSVDLRPGQFMNTIWDNNRSKFAISSTNKLSFTDSSGTPGGATAHSQSGKCSVAAAATSIVITNALVHANSHIVVTVASNDSTAAVKNVVPGAGSFTVNLTAPTAQTNLMWTLVQY